MAESPFDKQSEYGQPQTKESPKSGNGDILKQLPFKTTKELVLNIANTIMNPEADRLPEFSPIPKYMILPLVLNKVRERAADATRDKDKEPLSMVFRNMYCQCLRGGDNQTSMLGGNLAIGGLSGGEEADFPVKSRNI